MDNQTMMLKAIDFQKTVIGCGLSIVAGMQKSAEVLLRTGLEQSPWLPAVSKTACLYAAECSSKYLGNLQLMTEQGFSEMERSSVFRAQPKLKMPQQKQAKAKTSKPAAAPKRPSVTRKKAATGKRKVAQIAAAKTQPVKTEAVKTPPAKTQPAQQLISHEKPTKQQQ